MSETVVMLRAKKARTSQSGRLFVGRMAGASSAPAITSAT